MISQLQIKAPKIIIVAQKTITTQYQKCCSGGYFVSYVSNLPPVIILCRSINKD